MTAPATGPRHLSQLAIRPLIALLVLAVLQPLIAITTTVTPFAMGEATWRVRFFTLLLGAAPQLGVGLVVLTALGLLGGLRRPVRFAGFAFITLGVIIAVVAILNLLDSLQVRSLVAQDRIRAFELNAAQTIIVGLVLVPLLIWAGFRALDAGRPDEIKDEERGKRGLVMGDLAGADSGKKK